MCVIVICSLLILLRLENKQWGLYSSATDNDQYITYPLNFKNVFAVVLTKGGTYNDAPRFPYLKADNVTTSQFLARTFGTIPTVRWIALGTV